MWQWCSESLVPACSEGLEEEGPNFGEPTERAELQAAYLCCSNQFVRPCLAQLCEHGNTSASIITHHLRHAYPHELNAHSVNVSRAALTTCGCLLAATCCIPEPTGTPGTALLGASVSSGTHISSATPTGPMSGRAGPMLGSAIRLYWSSNGGISFKPQLVSSRA